MTAGILGLVYVAIVAGIVVAVWGANWYRRRGVELQPGEWLPWHPWLRRHPAWSGWTLAILNASVWVVWHPPKHNKVIGYTIILATSALLGVLAYFFGRRDLRNDRGVARNDEAQTER